GKRITGMRVVSADGRSLSPYSITVRNLMKEMEVFVPGTMLVAVEFISAFEVIALVVWIAILLAVPLMNRKRQRLGDMIAGTYVIYVPKAVLMPDMARATPAERFSFLNHQLEHYGRFELQTLERILQVDTSRFAADMMRRHTDNVASIVDKIRTKIEYTEPINHTDHMDFLQAFYLAQRRFLETRQLFGDAREDKFHQEDEETTQ
ncbi:MAG: RDD family protein, partial [Pseudomonadota bacterium]